MIDVDVIRSELDFWRFVSRTSTCWLWAGNIVPSGHGILSWRRQVQHAHRVAWTFVNGDIPHGLCVLHRCDVAECVNPSHLFLGTRADNCRDRSAKGRNGSTKGVNHPAAKLTQQDVEWVRTTVKSVKEIAQELGMSRSHIYRIRKGLYWH